jgi:hypothetical protein
MATVVIEPYNDKDKSPYSPDDGGI